MGYCNLPERLVGPYNQTLFLGCSIANFSCNLGWGAEASTLNVNLVEDNCFHPQSSQYGSMDLQLNSITQQPEETQSTALTQAQGSFTVSDPAKSLHKNIAFQARDLENARDQENTTLAFDNKDYGKVCYDINGNRIYWTAPDPFFVGAKGSKFHNNGYDILGTPVRFKFNDFVFGGMVSSWKQTGSQGGLRSFDVEIKSFASLLNGFQLIIGGYQGTVCGLIPNSDIAMPLPYNIIFTENSMPIFSFQDHRATINQGNIPNVMNIFGYLQYVGYRNNIYGNAGLNDSGMRAQYIYDVLVNLLGPNSENNADNKSPFFPYGAIIGRSIRVNQTSDEVDPLSHTYSNDGANINLTHMGICPNSIGIDRYRRSRFKLDLSELPRPPKWLRMQGPVISLMQFITEVCDGAGFDFFIDFITPNAQQVNQNISGIIKVRTVSRRVQARKEQIQALIDSFVLNAGVTSYNKGKEFTDVNTRSMYIGGKQKRLMQFKTERLAYTQNTLLWDPWRGPAGVFIEYNPVSLLTAPNIVRQPNLSSTRRYSYKSNGGAAVASDSTSFNNSVLFGTSRNMTQGNYLPAVGLSSGMGMESFDYVSRTVQVPGYSASRNIPLYTDAICPYFGVGANGLIRQVYFDKNMGQMQILFQVDDIAELTSLPLKTANYTNSRSIPGIPGAVQIAQPDQKLNVISNPLFMVLENEIRAAGAGLLPWLTYCFGNVFSTDIAQILFTAFTKNYGFGGKPAKQMWVAGINSVMGTIGRVRVGIDNRNLDQINLNGLSQNFKELYADLEKIHGFFQNIANEYYGKKYMVRMPELAWYRDCSVAVDNNDNPIVLGADENNNPIYAWEGTGAVYTNYSISTDGAWEEPGNMIDDTLTVGGIRASVFTDDSGKIGPIVGFNASHEFDTGRLYARQAFLSEAIRYRPFSDQPFTIFDWSMVMKLKAEDPLLQEANHWYAPLKHNLNPDESMTIPYISPALNIPMAHAVGVQRLSVPFDKRYKMYAKATCEEEMEYLAANYIQPRSIISVNSPVFVGVGRNATDDQLVAIMTQDAIARLGFGASVPSILQGLQTLGTYLGPFAIGAGSTSINGGLGVNPAYEDLSSRYSYASSGPLDYMLANLISSHVSAFGTENEISNGVARDYFNITEHRRESSGHQDPTRLLGKAAIPLFCAVPIEYNDLVYGPWINHPGLIRNDIFPDGNPILETENLIGGVKVQVDTNLVPWNYGGMSALDDAVMLQIADDVNYQQTLENGSVQIPGFANFNLGEMIDFFGEALYGPILTSINVQIGEGGVTSTYNFRTYTRKIGFFNKENAERIKLLNQETIKRNKEINNKLLKLAGKLGYRPGSFRII